MTTTYSIIEHAGSIDERVFANFRTIEDACGWMRDAYDPEEIETLDVRVAREVDGARVYEREESRVAARTGVERNRREESAARPIPGRTVGPHPRTSDRPSPPGSRRRILETILNSIPRPDTAMGAGAARRCISR